MYTIKKNWFWKGRNHHNFEPKLERTDFNLCANWMYIYIQFNEYFENYDDFEKYALKSVTNKAKDDLADFELMIKNHNYNEAEIEEELEDYMDSEIVDMVDGKRIINEESLSDKFRHLYCKHISGSWDMH